MSGHNRMSLTRNAQADATIEWSYPATEQMCNNRTGAGLRQMKRYVTQHNRLHVLLVRTTHRIRPNLGRISERLNNPRGVKS